MHFSSSSKISLRYQLGSARASSNLVDVVIRLSFCPFGVLRMILSAEVAGSERDLYVCG